MMIENTPLCDDVNTPADSISAGELRRHRALFLGLLLGELSGDFRLSLRGRALRHAQSWDAVLECAAEEVPRRFVDEAETQIETAARRGDRLLSILDHEYPHELRMITHPPAVVFLRGVWKSRFNVAIVGARACSSLGEEIAEKFAHELTLAGVAVVSGLARGIDGSAHRGVLRALRNDSRRLRGHRRHAAPGDPITRGGYFDPLSGGREGRELSAGMAVLGSGFDAIYPAEHHRLAEELVAAGGGILTEFPYPMPPKPPNFLQRNRLISALSDMVLVVEAAARSGSLSTARYAIEQSKEVGAIPGSITRRESGGSNDLLRQGAHVILETRDILLLVPPEKSALVTIGEAKRSTAPKGLSSLIPTELRPVYEHLSAEEPRVFDSIVVYSGLSSGQVASHLLDLELLGVIRQLPGGLYVRNGLIDTT